jgi:hypothetical protein
MGANESVDGNCPVCEGSSRKSLVSPSWWICTEQRLIETVVYDRAIGLPSWQLVPYQFRAVVECASRYYYPPPGTPRPSLLCASCGLPATGTCDDCHDPCCPVCLSVFLWRAVCKSHVPDLVEADREPWTIGEFLERARTAGNPEVRTWTVYEGYEAVVEEQRRFRTVKRTQVKLRNIGRIKGWPIDVSRAGLPKLNRYTSDGPYVSALCLDGCIYGYAVSGPHVIADPRPRLNRRWLTRRVWTPDYEWPDPDLAGITRVDEGESRLTDGELSSALIDLGRKLGVIY